MQWKFRLVKHFATIIVFTCIITFLKKSLLGQFLMNNYQFFVEPVIKYQIIKTRWWTYKYISSLLNYINTLHMFLPTFLSLWETHIANFLPILLLISKVCNAILIISIINLFRLFFTPWLVDLVVVYFVQ